MNEPEPLALDDVMAIVGERARRRHRRLLRGVIGTGALAAVAVATTAVDHEPAAVPADEAERPTTSGPEPAPTPAIGAAPPRWRDRAIVYAIEQVDFDFADASQLAALWQVDPSTAKAVVGEAMRTGRPSGIAGLVADPGDAALAQAVSDELRDAYWDAAYDLGDAEEHGARWGTERADTELMLGVRAVGGEGPDDEVPPSRS